MTCKYITYNVVGLIVYFIVDSFVYYKADTLRYDWGHQVIYLIGDAFLKYEDVTLAADTVVYVADSQLLYAWGNPKLTVKQQKIVGHKMAYNLKTNKGVILEGRSFVEKGWFTGREIYQVAHKTLNVKWGTFTTCELNPPHYYFWAWRMKIYLDDMVFAQPVILFVDDVPVFLLPYWYFPITGKRRSGWLYPKIGRGGREGRYIKNIAYYWVISERMDATFALDYLERRGWRFSGEWRLFKRSKLTTYVTGSYINERLTGRKRWELHYSHVAKWWGCDIRGNGTWISDASYRIDYEEKTLKFLDKILVSYLAISRRTKWGYWNVVLKDKHNLQTGEYERTLPSVSYSAGSHRLGPLYWGYGFNLVHSEKKGTSTEKWTHSGNVSSPLKVLRFFVVSPNLTWRYNFVKDMPASFSYNGGVGISTTIYGKTVFRPTIYHIMKPSVSYTERRELPRGGKSYALSLSLQNLYKMDWRGKSRTLLTVNLTSSWDFDLHELTPFKVYFFTPVLENFSLAGGATFFYKTLELKDLHYTVSVKGRIRGMSYSMTYNVTPHSRYVWGGASFNPTRKWSVRVNMRYDLVHKELIEESYTLTRDLHCWELVFSYTRYGDRWRYDFNLRIKAIPEVRVTRGLMPFLFPE